MSITVLVENSILLFFSSRTSRLVKSNISGKHQGWVGKIKHYQVGKIKANVKHHKVDWETLSNIINAPMFSEEILGEGEGAKWFHKAIICLQNSKIILKIGR